MLKQQSQIPTCHLCDKGMALDSVTYPDSLTGELMMVHQKCLDETGVTRRMKAVESYKDGKKIDWVLDNEVVLKAQSLMSPIELLSSLVRPAKVLFAKRLSKNTKPTSEPQPKKVVKKVVKKITTDAIKFGKWSVTYITWHRYVDAVRKMKSLYDPNSLRNLHSDLPPDPIAQLAQFNKRVALHKKLFKEASVPYHANKNATHASHELSQLMSDRLEKEI